MQNTTSPSRLEMESTLKESNLKHSRNGDPETHLLESLSIKLQYALQGDNSVYAEITMDEIVALEDKRLSVRTAIQEKELNENVDF